MKVWWLGSKNGQGNFGDILTPFIFDYFGINYTWVPSYKDADAICVGSIARRASAKTTVLGSGIIKKGERITPNSNWKFVRGPITRNRILELGGNCPELYGDPALLLPLIYNPIILQKHKLGYIPHNVDYSTIVNDYDNVINLRTNNYKRTIDQILMCEAIVSSSLHGIIVAHAYGIPAAWAESINPLKGDNVKFEDYFQSVGITDYIQSTYDNPIFINPGKIDLNPIIEIFKSLA
jgi:pyruvyltransferase